MSTWQRRLEVIWVPLALVLLPILWPYSVVQSWSGRRELARLTSIGQLVNAVETSELMWRLRFADGSERQLAVDEIQRGTWYEFEDHNGGFQQTDWQTVLSLELVRSGTLILIGPVTDGRDPDPLAEPCKVLLAAGRVRGRLRRSRERFGDLLDCAMMALWLLALFILALFWAKHA